MLKTRVVKPSDGKVTASHSGKGTRHIRTKESDAVDLARAARIKELIGDDPKTKFAEDCGFSEGMLRKYLKGATPGSDKLAAMAKHRRVRMEWLSDGEPPKYERDLMAIADTKDRAQSSTLRAHQYMQAAGNNHQDGHINSDLLRMCLLACRQLHGETFVEAIFIVQLEYACDFYNHLVTMANAKGPRTSLDDFCRLDTAALTEQLRFFLQMGWARPFPFQAPEANRR